ncbi:hypothetical protein GCM10027169_21060 [Gordonia jinhuaensis]|uniref:Preprotein translocase subunit YajC n=1 Tax=Gordonia jinhuaensis TaxID=1517702 RepID=A0A916TH27_9ACTN|nr:preprotein translocase subunit YajC [Gordonia jinhuaensis]GGB43445.1 hypothetical protein GCM10011489_33690 [Gordonia jinhuaensis]
MSIILPVILVLLAGFMYLQIRRQKKAVAQAQQMQDSLQAGARVQTTSGVYGTVVGLGDGVVDLELAPGYVTRWNRLAVREVVHPDDLPASFPGYVAPENHELSDDHLADGHGATDVSSTDLGAENPQFHDDTIRDDADDRRENR